MKRSLHRVSYILLAIYSFILLVGGLHIHHHAISNAVAQAVIPADCSQEQPVITENDDCTLCRLLHTAYIPSTPVRLPAEEVASYSSPVAFVRAVCCNPIDAYCLRAPPMF